MSQPISSEYALLLPLLLSSSSSSSALLSLRRQLSLNPSSASSLLSLIFQANPFSPYHILLIGYVLGEFKGELETTERERLAKLEKKKMLEEKKRKSEESVELGVVLAVMEKLKRFFAGEGKGVMEALGRVWGVIYRKWLINMKEEVKERLLVISLLEMGKEGKVLMRNCLKVLSVFLNEIKNEDEVLFNSTLRLYYPLFLVFKSPIFFNLLFLLRKLPS
jgi:hypothetical protein